MKKLGVGVDQRDASAGSVDECTDEDGEEEIWHNKNEQIHIQRCEKIDLHT